jgi:hypothetical protein
MQTLYPSEQASALLANLTANEAARQELMENPQAVLRAYGFEVDVTALPEQIALAGNGAYENVLATLANEDLEEDAAKQAIAVFVLDVRQNLRA